MDFIEICEVFGGSIFPEEYRGSFAEADRRISALEAESPGEAAARPVEHRAKALLLRSIYWMLAGDFPKARSGLQTVTSLQEEGLSKRWILRCKMYTSYAAMLQHRSALVRFSLLPGDPFERLKEGDSALGEILHQAQEAGLAIVSLQPPNAVDMLEEAMILDAWTFLDAFHFSFLAHPAFARSVTAESLPRSCVAGIEFDNIQVPYASARMADVMAQSGNTAFKNTIERWSVEIEAARGSPNADRRLAQLFSQYEKEADYVGMGLCKMSEGDRVLSPSYTSPIALNLICQIRENGWENQTWDPLERTFQLRDDINAQQCYSQALFYMEAADAPRGQAAVYLRRGCVSHAEALISKSRAHEVDAAEAFQESENDFRTALQLFARDKDETNEQLVTCHQILLACSRGDVVMPLEKATRLGSEMRRMQNQSVSHFLGALMLRFGHFQFAVHGDSSVAAVCCRCAGAYYGKLGDPLGSLWASIAHIMLLKRTHAVGVAEAKIRETIRPSSPLRAIVAYIDGLLARGPSFRHLQVVRDSILTEFDTIVLDLCSMGGSEVLQSQWEEVRQPLQPGKTPDIMPPTPLSPDARDHLNDPLLGCGAVEQDYFTQTCESRDTFISSYHRCLAESVGAIGRGDMDAAEAELQRFITSCESQNALRKRDVLAHKIPALCHLDRVQEMQEALPEFLSDWFATENGGDIRTEFHLRGIPADVVELAVKERANKAHEDLAMCFIAQAWDKGSAILRNISRTLPEFFVRIRTEPKPDSWQLLTFIGAFYEHEGRLEKALESYLESLHQLENLRKMIPNPDDRRAAYSSLHTAEMFCGLVRTSFALDLRIDERGPHTWGLPASSWADQALVFLEQGKARALLDILLARESAATEELQGSMDELYRNRLLSTLFQSRCHPQEDMGMGEPNVAERTVEVVRKLQFRGDAFDPVKEALKGKQDTTSQIFKGTLFVPDTLSLFSSIPPDAIVIEVAICMSGMVVSCISSTGVQSVHQSSLGVYQLRKLVVRYIGKIKALQQHPSRQETEDLNAELTAIAASISSHLIEPFAHLIRTHKSIIFAPTSYLNVFPLGALLLDGEPLIVIKPVYQVPSLSVLRRLSKIANKPSSTTTTSSPISVSVLADCGPDRGSLNFAGPEVVSICNSMRTKPTTQKHFEAALTSSDIIHITSHGSEEYSSPWTSTIHLAEREFRIIDMATTPSAASLVVFSSCLSGRGPISAGDDLVGFAHAVLQSGALAFLGGLWQASNEATMLLMHLFYKRLSAQQSGSTDAGAGGPRSSLAECWHEAVRDFYRMDSRRAKALLEELLRLWIESENQGTWPDGDFCCSGFMLEEMMAEIDRGEWDFRLPCHWASFALVGYGDAVVKGGGEVEALGREVDVMRI
ncbi:CHAT domain-containing protein [Aspergillus egyptiacus]|nr:CHAT domain-containing protein [Aspergillus egyptiacus]